MKTIKYHNRVETLNDKGELHSFNDKPAVDWVDCDKFWYKNGKLHRDDKPAIISIYNLSRFHHYYQNGLRHRFLKPASIKWETGIKSYEKYYLKDRLHNPIGPAKLWYPPYYDFERVFYVNGNELSFDEFIKQLEGRLNL